MVFSSLTFLCVFLPIVFCAYNLARTLELKNIILVIASITFYAYGEPIYVLLMLISTGINYLFGILLEKDRKKIFMFAAIFFNLGVLGIFKYADMAAGMVNYIFQCNIPMPSIALPIGISFFTFQIMSYVLDVYRKEVKAQKNFCSMLLYISFFPQLIAGPIIKYHDIDLQIAKRSTDTKKIAKGLRRFIIGLAKKVIIANGVALTADRIFQMNTGEINIITAWLAAITYMLQIYYDFSGYSDMAIGLGHVFGFTYMENFEYPYISQSIKEFWRRWHISLSTWFKEYLYIPLGGNRKGKVRTCANKMIVFFCTGLWHGANWTFVIWGIYHGCFLMLEEIIPIKKIPRMIKHLYTIVVVCVGFVIFRADTIQQAVAMIGKMFFGWDFSEQMIRAGLQYCTPMVIFLILAGIIGACPWKKSLESYIEKYSEKIQGISDGLTYFFAILLLGVCVLNLSGGTYNPFIYFRF